VPLRPAQVHPQEHRRPVGRFRAAGPGADREDRRAVVVLAREQELRALPGEVALQGLDTAVDLRLELGVARLLAELQRGLEVIGAGEEGGPEVDLGAEAVGLAQDVLRRAAVGPESRR
jgi:hypothetical protein